MMKVIKFQGGLGNQMFQYAMYLALKKQHPLSVFLFDVDGSIGCHNGFELPQLFPLVSRNKSTWYIKLRHRMPFLFKRITTLRQPQSLTFYPEFLSKKNGCYIYEGFWQSEMYFEKVKKVVTHHFEFDTKLLNSHTSELSRSLFNDGKSVSVHIRRGDYLEEPFRLTCNLEYYKKAISYIKEKVNDPHFYFFSDDIEWVEENFPGLNATFVNWNRSQDSWQDMYLMSLCKHNIVANSSFSWWGAWLNKNDSKIVVAPSLWFKDGSKHDIQPKSWHLI